jgi:hypothetical protein
MPLQRPFGLLATTLMMLFYVLEQNTWTYGKKQIIVFCGQLKIELTRIVERVVGKRNVIHPHTDELLPESQLYI